MVLFVLLTSGLLTHCLFFIFFCFNYLLANLSNVFELPEEILQSHRSLLTFTAS